ncbi:NitT/TauT family transport system permease protein [Cryobacterium mesophilum]|uniref:ABC transporter permease subunit n=1 Tax=Terrimesophilobacter mesophilus TaxID=433647 RepID=A0A4V6QGE2_9MICO|nr:ABC transporter permease subunit [Terrimesophilobacter mesophilus]MBB5632523.1 NitT/TauT family transport system permease protein [Terrimesophilobacter mesophilus]TFB79348.1 ABC transporter permease subunit [Terrimesophilobacter mesophilus]
MTETATRQFDAVPATRAKGAAASKSGRAVAWRRWILGALGIVFVGVAWEVYKLVGPEKGFTVGELILLPRTNDLSMPHIATMFERLSEPLTGASNSIFMWQAVVEASEFSLYVAAVGWIIGVSVGLLLALVMQRFRTAQSAVLPWIILSQTVPLIAIAPLVRRWGAQIQFGDFVWENWMSVALIASYLAFFPVSIGALKGLNSPDTNHVELFRSFGVGWWKTLVKLRIPASVPYLMPALQLAAANAVIGTIVAEVSIGLKGGIGRMVIEFAGAAGGDPGKPWAPIFGAVAIGLIAAGVVAVLGLFVRRYRRGETNA